MLIVIGGALALTFYVLVAERQLIGQRAGRVLIFLALVAVPTAAAALGAGYNLKRSTETHFCLSCHEMQPYGKSLLIDDNEPLPAVHYQKRLVDRNAACYTCHRDYALFGDLTTKLNGLRHVWVHFTRGAPTPIKLYQPYSNANCLHCHAGARGYETSKHHETSDAHLTDMTSGKLSCLTKGCHGVTHSIADLKDADFWKHPAAVVQ